MNRSRVFKTGVCFGVAVFFAVTEPKKKKKKSPILFRKRRACLISTLTATMFAIKLKSRGQPLTRQKSVSLVCVPLFKQGLFPCDEVPGPVQTPLNMTGATSAWHLITSGVFFCQNKSHLDFCLATPNPKRTWTFQVSEWNVIITFRNRSSLNTAGYCFWSLKLLGWSALSLRVRGCRAQSFCCNSQKQKTRLHLCPCESGILMRERWRSSLATVITVFTCKLNTWCLSVFRLSILLDPAVLSDDG